ncbi:hypothetical protein A1Q2_07599 [Trichosporon asahii var. asahii CBS 8904]|uniref:DNA polymerase epsilon subunit D n=1 Tax=Trichosporon asahii var. asahii (strain CBS 8904) TaxID=1220162 RepID=K1W8U5_TRIAC|nr:hypothetical protein A1Q2_07599 [Trichosporon asahii var. asahii CBS 8904]
MPPKASTTTNDAPPSPASVQQRPFMPGIAEYELPKTNLIKLAKGSESHNAAGVEISFVYLDLVADTQIPDNVKMQQDVVTALLRSSTLFINFLSAHAHDQALERSGKSITAGDVLKAVTELDFGPADALVPILEQELAGS